MIGGEGYTKIGLWNSAGDVEEDFFQFAVHEEDQIRVFFDDLLDCPDKVLDNWEIKRFIAGKRIRIELDFLFDDWVTTTSNDGHSCQVFLKNLHNHAGKIKITPHIDKSSQTYWVLRDNPWEYLYPLNRWRGVKGTLMFKGAEKLSSIDIVE